MVDELGCGCGEWATCSTGGWDGLWLLCVGWAVLVARDISCSCGEWVELRLRWAVVGLGYGCGGCTWLWLC